MKKTYVAPTLVPSGNLLRDTLGGSKVTNAEPNFKPTSAGGVGFYL